MQIDHFGIATPDAGKVATLFESLLDAPIVHEEEFDGLEILFLDLGNGYFEFLEPLTDDGPIARYLERNGPGIHHAALATNDIHGALETARAMGLDLIDDTPRPGAWGHEVAFLHPDSTGGILLEFVEREERERTDIAG